MAHHFCRLALLASTVLATSVEEITENFHDCGGNLNCYEECFSDLKEHEDLSSAAAASFCFGICLEILESESTCEQRCVNTLANAGKSTDICSSIVGDEEEASASESASESASDEDEDEDEDDVIDPDLPLCACTAFHNGAEVDSTQLCQHPDTGTCYPHGQNGGECTPDTIECNNFEGYLWRAHRHHCIRGATSQEPSARLIR